MGDTNCYLISSEISNGTSDHMCDIYLEFGMKQLIVHPTRETVTTSTLIDHLATTHPNDLITSGI